MIPMVDDAPKENHPSSDLRRTRRLQAAYAMANSLRGSSSFRWSGPLNPDQSHARALEIEALLALLKEGDLPGERANTKGDEQVGRSVRTILLSSVRPGTEYLQFSWALDTLERVLSAQLIVLGASPISETPQQLAMQVTAGEELSTLNLAEPVLPATHFEKFYRSTAFKIMGAGLLAAALVAGGEALFTGAKVAPYAEHGADPDGSSGQLAALNTEVSQESARLGEIKKQIDAQEAALSGGVLPRIKQLREQLSVARAPLCDQPVISDSSDGLQTQLDCLKTRIAEIEAQAPIKQTGSLPKNELSPPESELSPQQWRQIQEALADKRFYKGKVDGKPGRPSRHFKWMTSTRRAIFQWQGALSEKQTGTLAPQQIEQLLSSAPAMR
jgi:hypothetical protein